MFDLIEKSLLVYGPLGATCAVSMLISLKLYKDLAAERKACREEMHALEERYITKADTWMTQYHELQKRMTDLIEAIGKKRG